jgi:arsenate reductase-like glutaredoxin family protein
VLSQAKIDLAVLLKLFQHAESNGGAETPNEIWHLFTSDLSLRRVEVALQTLEARGEVERKYHPHYSEEGLWQISREGIRTVEKALRNPTTFIARLNANDEGWLASEEAIGAVLNKNTRYQEPIVLDGGNAAGLLQGNHTLPLAPHAQASINWTKWGTIFAGVGIVVTILIAVLS